MTAVKTSENVIPENLQEKLEKNLFRHSKAPYGYKLVDGKYATVPEQVKTVKEIFSMVLSGNGTNLIARELNHRKIPTETLKKMEQRGVCRPLWSRELFQMSSTREIFLSINTL
jgi:DNA invertase Pin-like site-specific DNA recombinase